MPEPSWAHTFVDVLIRGVTRPLARARAAAAATWLRDSIRKAQMSTREIMDENRARMRSNVIIGSMYLFEYDPKHKKTLPYYDIYPLIFPIDFYPDGFLGINMHYLPPIARAQLMDSLYSLLNNTRFDARTKLNISYQILKGASKYHYFKPCVKRYLYSHVSSRFMKIQPIEWDFVLWTPLAKFKKAPITRVWSESMEKIGA